MYNNRYNKKIYLSFLTVLLPATTYLSSKTDDTITISIQLLDSQINELETQWKQTPQSLIVDGYAQKELLWARMQSLQSARTALIVKTKYAPLSLWQKIKNKVHTTYCLLFGIKKENLQSQKINTRKQNSTQKNQHKLEDTTTPISHKHKKGDIDCQARPNHTTGHDYTKNTSYFSNKIGEKVFKRGNKNITITQLRVAKQRDGVSCGAHAIRSAEILYRYLTQSGSPDTLNTELNNAQNANTFIKKWFTCSDMLLGDGVEKIRDRLGFNQAQISVWDSPAITELCAILDMNIPKSQPHAFVVNSASQNNYKNAGHWITIAFDGDNQIIIADSCNQSRIYGDSRVESVINFLWS